MKLFNKRTATVAASVALAGGAAALALSGPFAGAAPANTTRSLQLTYSCGFSWWGGPRLAVSLTGVLPTSVVAGHSFTVSHVTGTATVPAGAVNQLRKSMASLSGTVTSFVFTSSGASPAEVDLAPLSFGPVRLTAGQPAVLRVPSSPESVGPFTAGSGRSVTIVPAKLSIQLQAGTMQCTDTTPAGSRSSWTVAVIRLAKQQTPLPISTFGSAGAAAVAGGLLWLRLRRKSSVSVEPHRPE